MQTLYDLKPGDKVWLVHHYGRDAAVEVLVTKVGRTLLYVERYGRTEAYRLETGSLNSKQYSYQSYVRTNDQRIQDDNVAGWKQTVRDAGLNPDSYRASMTAERWQKLAALVESW